LCSTLAEQHFVVPYKIAKGKYHIADPASGNVSYTEKEFAQHWVSRKQLHDGLALFLSPTPQFYDEEGEGNAGLNWSILFSYRSAYKKLILQLMFGLGIGSIIQLIGPFLTQAIVDTGIQTRN